MNASVKDYDQRLAALDISKSFIVQAPAGSGKTELLTQRFLVLLATVRNAPEEIVAITFTRKAASEMRARIFEALQFAENNAPPSSSHELQTWQLAKKVLLRDRNSNWNLLKNPNRLRVLTIDALCAKIAKSAPLVSHFGVVPEVIEDANPYYTHAARMLLSSLDENQAWGPVLETLLLHLDNNYFLTENLFIGMLSRRDQWLPYIAAYKDPEESRVALEQGLKNIILNTIGKCQGYFTDEEKLQLIELCRFAGQILKDAGIQTKICDCADLKIFPTADLNDYSKWLGLAELLLTKTFDWRRTVNKNCGFPAKSDAMNFEEEVLFKNMKERMQNLLQQLSKKEELRNCLQEILTLPTPFYSEKQWEVIKALIELLPVLVAYLNVIFRERNVVDFIAIAQGAIDALGERENPSDVALNLDYRISHLLVDEFQDTSVTQYRLFELLIAGWEKDDGRTLFLVGDPMQSIYRFREAEVGLFLKVRKLGIGAIHPLPLLLEVNFRSEKGIVEWINKTFQPLFPKAEDIDSGSIPFKKSVAYVSENSSNRQVKVHQLIAKEPEIEAELIVTIIKKELSNNEDASIAILVRSRTHLSAIIPALKNASLAFQAVEIEKLIYSTAVQDLFALTRALIHPGDRIAWLAILRAPWCGLNLSDLYRIANYNTLTTIWDTLQVYDQIEDLSPSAKQRLSTIVPILNAGIKNRYRSNLSQWLANIWYALGGPACIQASYELQNTHTYLQLLDEIENHNQMIDFDQLEKKIANSYTAHTADSNAKIQVMTIHKAKGLEFDIVIVPALEKKPTVDENRLLMWLERQNATHSNDLILAPIKSFDEEFDPIYRYLRKQDNIKSNNEIIRLLYVAVTRAKKSLHLIGTVFQDAKDETIKEPVAGSLLNILWPVIKDNDSTSNDFNIKNTNIESAVDVIRSVKLTRLKLEWKMLKDMDFTLDTFNLLNQGKHKVFSWSLQFLHHIGTVIHQTLQKISEENLHDWNSEKISNYKLIWTKQLFQLGVVKDSIDFCVNAIEKAIINTLTDSRGKWILSSVHIAARSEFPLSALIDDQVTNIIIDRTFIDDKGYRWIIDYKTTEIVEGEMSIFLAKAKERYKEQLTKYAKVFSLLENNPIKLGLYFPLFGGWCEWEV